VPTCIYCKQTAPPCGFNTEHVIQNALGHFRNNLTLSDSEVCRDCNSFFDKHLDIMLTRDSYEALLRIEHGLKDAAEIGGMFKGRVTIRLPADGTNWGGAMLELQPNPEGRARPPVVNLVPQIGFERKDGGGWEFVAEEDLLAERGIAERVARMYGNRRVILFDSDATRDRLFATLAELGIPFKKEDEFRGFPPLERGKATTEVQARFDDILARAVCKIAVNYMAKTQGAEFALRSEFDAVRRYVRYSDGKGGAFLAFDDASGFRNTAGQPLRRSQHTLMLEWNGNREELIGRVHLFGETRYAVRLCTMWGGVWRPIMSGHVFDLESMEVTELHQTTIAPPWIGMARS
jgi:HNH endonuclease